MFKKPLFLFTSIFLIAVIFSSCKKDNRPTRAFYNYLESSSQESSWEELIESFEDKSAPSPLLDGQEVSSLTQIAKFVLMQGNLRFVNGNTTQNQWNQENSGQLSNETSTPIAAVFLTSQLDTPLENIFDQRQGSFSVIKDFTEVENIINKNKPTLLLVMGSVNTSSELAQVKRELQENKTNLMEIESIKSRIGNATLEIVETLYHSSTKKVDFLNE
jgi:hypothetical protein